MSNIVIMNKFKAYFSVLYEAQLNLAESLNGI